MNEFEQVLETITRDQTANYSAREAMILFPGVVAHIIAESLGYATPTLAARILRDALAGQQCYCEWIDACFAGNPRPAVVRAIEGQNHHKRHMASYSQARLLVDQALETRKEPLLASWF